MFRWLSTAEIEAKALGLLRRTFGEALDRSRPIDLEDVLCHLSEAEHLSYDLDAELPPEDGDTVLGKTLPLQRKILISQALRGDPERARFTIAHEIGHWVLHRPAVVESAQQLALLDAREGLYEFGGFTGSGTWVLGRSRTTVPREEWQANRFAVALLIDTSVLAQEFERRFGERVIARQSPQWRFRNQSLREHSRWLARYTADAHPPIREVFGVSIEAMAIALETCGHAVERLPQVELPLA